jgi:hypothetical protein
MSDSTSVYVAVVIHPPKIDDWGEPVSRHDTDDYIDERFSWENRDKRDPSGPRLIGYGYEINEAWGAGQDQSWKDYGSKARLPHIYGYDIAGTWAGVIEFNKDLRTAIEDAKESLLKWFPEEESQIIVVGQQT